MRRFPYAHATHALWQVALAQAVAQLRAQMDSHVYASTPSLGLLYLTDHYAGDAAEILATLGAELPLVTDWSGTVGVGVCAGETEYFDVPALAILLLDVPSDQYRVFSGVSPLGLGFAPQVALVHADGATPDIVELVGELAQRTDAGFLFGGMTSGRTRQLQFAISGDGNMRGQGRASGVFGGGLSGVAFDSGVQIISRVTQGCMPVGAQHHVTAADGNVILELDHQPALQVLLDDLGITLDQPRQAMDVLRSTLIGMADDGGTLVHQTGTVGSQVAVRHIIGLDPARAGVAVACAVETGLQIAFCQRNPQAARADLVRICAEIRDELETGETSVLAALAPAGDAGEALPARRIVGAIYVSCTGRGGPHFGAPHAELQLVRRALGEVPLVGFFAAGEIGYDRVYSYTGVLTVFVD